jgi:hypothetical protein
MYAPFTLVQALEGDASWPHAHGNVARRSEQRPVLSAREATGVSGMYYQLLCLDYLRLRHGDGPGNCVEDEP